MKRLSFLLIWALILSMLAGPSRMPPMSAHAAEDPVPPQADGWVLVSTPEQLLYINQNPSAYLDQNIRLMSNIDLGGNEWIPFGDGSAAFSGEFDGNGHLISGVTIRGEDRDAVGFFGMVTGTVRNVGVSVQVLGGYVSTNPSSAATNTGGLVGILSGGSVDRSYSTGSVIGTTNSTGSTTGGLVGTAFRNSSITRSYSSASVQTGPGGNQYAGGLVGSQGAGSIRNSFAKGTVANAGHSGMFFFAGGLAGQLMFGTIEHSYAAGAVTSTEDVSNKTIGGFAGTVGTGSLIVGSYFDNEATGQPIGTGSFSGDSIRLTGLSTDQMRDLDNYDDWDDNVWTIHPGVNDGYPYLRPAALTTSLPAAVKNAPYSAMLAGFDGASASLADTTDGLTWSASGLPAGLSVSPSGLLEGIPSESGVFSVSLTVTDAGGATDTVGLTLVVNELAPDLEGLTIAPGNALGSTQATAIPGDEGRRFAYVLDSAAGARSLIGSLAPDDAMPYSPGEDIPGASVGQYLIIYELDADDRIQAWSSFRLEADDIQGRIAVTGVSVEPSALTLTVGQSPQQLTAIVQPGDATDRSVVWGSSDPDVAAVDESGAVTPLAVGSATITAVTVDGSHTATSTITVQPAPPTAGTVIGEVYGTGNTPLPGASVSVGEARAAADSHGRFVLTNIAAGSHTLTVKASGYLDYTEGVTVVAGETVDAGRIQLVAASGESDAPPIQASPSPMPVKSTIRINGHDVAFVKETASDGRSVLRVIPDAAFLNDAFKNGPEAVIPIDNDDPIVKVDLPARLLQDVSNRLPDAVIRIQVNGASYSLPLRIWNDVPSESTVTIAIASASDTVHDEVNDALTRQGFAMLAAPVDFTVTIDDVEMTHTGAIYTEREIMLDTGVHSGSGTGVWVDADLRPHFVPSVFRTEEGGTTAIFYAPHNSVYTVIESGFTFEDLNGHWAQQDVETLANKLVVQGVDPNAFDPDSPVTRAEFTAMLVRALGLLERPGTSVYTDITIHEDAWYAGAVGAAREAGLIGGYADGTFRPNAPVTREQMAVMIERAIRFAGGNPPHADADALSRYADHAGIADWAKEAVRTLTAGQLLNGISETTFAPQAPATRAQSAVALKRMLESLDFID